MFILYIFIVIFLLSYFLLPRAMWSTYFSDWRQLVFKALLGLVLAIPLYILLHANVLPFVLGYMLMDPHSYYWIIYRKQYE